MKAFEKFGRRGRFGLNRDGFLMGRGWNPENSLLGAGEGIALSRFHYMGGGAAW